MEHFLVVTNRQKDKALACTNRIRGYLERHGKRCHIRTGEEAAFDIPADTECVIVLGGDGTLLRAARTAADAGVPLIGVNLGTLGYLAEVNGDMLEEALDQLIRDDFKREKRMMLTGRIVRGEHGLTGSSDGKHDRELPAEEGERGAAEKMTENCALNDIAITRRGSLQIIVFHIYVNGQLLYTCHADGILVATPTGSTGYNLSAGGPIVEPHAELILLTPVCPHSMNGRTIVLSAEDEVVIEIGENKKGAPQDVEACFDGSVKMAMHTGDKMEVKRAKKVTEMLKLRQDSFVEVLNRKMDVE